MGKNNKVRYSPKKWSVIIGVLFIICILIVITGLAVKCVVEYISIQKSTYHVMGTVTVAEYTGEFTDYIGDTASTGHKYVHYVITFDEETAGHTYYEYENYNDYSAKLEEGSRSIVTFDDFNKKVNHYDPDDFIPDRIALALFVILLIASAIFGKRLVALWKKVDSF